MKAYLTRWMLLVIGTIALLSCEKQELTPEPEPIEEKKCRTLNRMRGGCMWRGGYINSPYYFSNGTMSFRDPGLALTSYIPLGSSVMNANTGSIAYLINYEDSNQTITIDRQIFSTIGSYKLTDAHLDRTGWDPGGDREYFIFGRDPDYPGGESVKYKDIGIRQGDEIKVDFSVQPYLGQFIGELYVYVGGWPYKMIVDTPTPGVITIQTIVTAGDSVVFRTKPGAHSLFVVKAIEICKI